MGKKHGIELLALLHQTLPVNTPVVAMVALSTAVLAELYNISFNTLRKAPLLTNATVKITINNN